MFKVLKSYSIAIAIAAVCTYMYIISLEDFITMFDKVLVGSLVVSTDLAIIYIIIESYKKK